MSHYIYEPVAPTRSDKNQTRLNVDTLKGKTVGFIDNSKNNFDHLADHMGRLLLERYGVKSIVRHRKHMASIPASGEIIDDIVARCDVVVTGAGD